MEKSPFKYCPKCKSDNFQFVDNKEFQCRSCGWNYFHNVAAATATIIEYQDKILFIVRNINPGKGMLDIPGGFIDHNESAKEAALRECYEETNIKLENISYFNTYPNTYLYKNILYFTCDIIFTASVKNINVKIDKKEVDNIKFIKKDKIDPGKMAFPSIKNALRDFLNR